MPDMYDACPECASDVDIDELGLYFCTDESCGWREDVKELSFDEDDYFELEAERED